MRKIPVGTAQPRGLAAFKTVQKKVQRGRAEAQARQDFVSIPLKIGCITMWAIAGLFLFSLMRPAAEPMGAETEARPESPAATPAQAAPAAPAAATPAAQTAAAPAAPAVPAAAAPAAPKAQPPAADQCGCLPGLGWSLTTGRGCCKAGSVTQPHELAACQAALGNTDCTPPAAASAAADQCGCLPGFGWSLTTGRGCCKAGSITQPEELAGCRATLGNTDCAPAVVAADKDQCGCLAGFGWSLTTGRGCCKAGSITQPQELADCQATLGNTDCVPAPAAKDAEPDAAAVAKDSDAADPAAAVPAAASEPAAVPAVADACAGEGSGVRQYLHELQEEKSRVGYGRLGKGNSLGFEGITPRVKGVAYSHVLSTHPGSGARGAATVDYTLPATPAGGRWCRLEASVAINDKNNFFGKAGSPLTFSVVDISGCAADCPRSYAEPVLWQSNPVQNTEVVQSLRVELPPGVRRVRFRVAAAGSNACAHAVWLEPTLVA